MPTHLYRLVGRWDESKSLNQRAAAVDDKYVADQKPSGLYPLVYRNHNVHFVAFSAATEGNSAEALRAARDLYDHVPSELVAQMPMAELFTPWPILVLIRFGRWEDIEKEPAPPPYYHYTTGMWHFARGLAFTHEGDLEKAAIERDSVDAIAAPMSPDLLVGFNSSKTLLGIASKVLSGEMAARQKRYDEAERTLRQAVAIEDSLHYDEPPTWYFPTRQNLGAVLLEAGKPAQAEVVYRADLKRNPNNGWSLFGLEQCLKARKAVKEAAAVEAQFKAAWAHADVTLTSSRL
jgi:tetratricopeptide (TPR) repeat protein